MGDFERALPIILRFEGGYVNDPDDPGGETNFGVTKRVYDGWRRARGLPIRSVRFIAPEEVASIYKTNYWLAAKCDKMSWPLCLIHFDGAVNTGVKRATQLLQAALGLNPDGVWGPRTLAGVQAATEFTPYKLMLLRVWFYKNICITNTKLIKFILGWLKRMQQLAEIAFI